MIYALLSASLLLGCAPSRGEVRAPALEASNEEAGAPGPEPAAEAAPATRPRLSRTVTLGQGVVEPYTPPPSAAPGPSPSVVVNNSIVVQAAPPVYGYGYGYGYGRYPADGYAHPSAAAEARGGRGAPGWGASGWEGPRGTAAPGRTPGVAGNWAPPPSYGPATMK